jgi:UrcA family protein
MNAQTSLYCPSTRAVIATACVALSAVAPLAAFADAPTAPATHTLESKVSLADLDLSTAKGVRAAHKRLTRMAEHLCRQLWDSTSFTFRWTYAACVQETLANPIQQLNVPALAAINGARAKP